MSPGRPYLSLVVFVFWRQSPRNSLALIKHESGLTSLWWQEKGRIIIIKKNTWQIFSKKILALYFVSKKKSHFSYFFFFFKCCGCCSGSNWGRNWRLSSPSNNDCNKLLLGIEGKMYIHQAHVYSVCGIFVDGGNKLSVIKASRLYKRNNRLSLRI